MTTCPNTINTTAPSSGDWQELDARRSDGLSIALQWSSSLDRVKIVILSVRGGQGLEFEVPAAEARPAFAHPFAYAAARGLSMGDPRPASDPPTPQSAAAHRRVG